MWRADTCNVTRYAPHAKGEVMRELIEYMAKSLVDRPEQVRVRETGSGQNVTLYLHVATDDMGRIIGKSGRVASAMRILLKVAAIRQGKRVTLEIK
jgi:uncharacterized protein